MKKYILLSILLVTSLPAFSQHFDWVKSYSGNERLGELWNYIVSSVTDSHGNLYVAGQFANGASIDGHDLLPFPPYGSGNNNPNATIIKFSSDGQILWSKALHANQYNPCNITSMQLIGDSALYVMGHVNIPRGTSDYLYFFDTLITKENASYLTPQDGITYAIATVVAILDLDGNVVEHHFLQTAYIDNDNNVITLERQSGNPSDSVYILNNDFQQGPFCVDKRGNIYIGHVPVDMIGVLEDQDYQYYSVANGLLSGVLIIVDGKQRFIIHPENTPSADNFRLLKFSPHFDSLIHFQYVFEGNIPWNGYQTLGQMKIDSSDCIYLCTYMAGTTSEDTCSIQDAPDMMLHINSYMNTFLAKYDSDLSPIYIKQIDYGVLENGISVLDRHNLFHAICIDEDSNALFVSATVNNDSNEPLFVDNNVIELRKSAIILRFDKESGNYITYGNANSSTRTFFSGKIFNHSTIECRNNRVFAPIAYQDNIQCLNQDISIEHGKMGKGVYIWDYQGHPLQYIDLNSITQTSECGTSLSLRDSALYICGYTTTDMTFGNLSLNCTNGSTAYIAKYVDTSFMTPYVYTGPQDTGDVRIKVVEDGNAFVAYPNPFRQKVNIQVESGELKVENGVAIAWLTDMQGRREEVRLTPAGNGKYTLDLTSRGSARTSTGGPLLLTLTTATGKTHTFRLLKQSDIFSR
jgi:hypothetical protein